MVTLGSHGGWWLVFLVGPTASVISMNSHSVAVDCGTSKKPTSGGWSDGELEIMCGDGGQQVDGLVASGANRSTVFDRQLPSQ